MAVVERRPAIYAGSRIPHPIPTVLQTDPGLEDVLTVNFGPNHPSTHGVLRLIVDLHGEHIVGLSAVIGYLHTGFEKTMEQKTWWKGVTYPARVDYVSFQYNELVYVLAVEKLLQLEVPRKATWMRMALGELSRIHSHLVYLGTSALEIGAISMFWYCFRERDLVLDLFEMVTGVRMHTRYFQVGGLAEDIPRGFYDEARTFCERMPKAIDEYEAILNSNRIWLERTKGVGLLSAEDAIALGQTGPNLRASGVDWDLRRREPYLAYDQVDFHVPVYHGGDVYDRYKRAGRRDARVDQDHRPVHRPARGDARRAVDRRRPQGRAAAARGAAHVDGVADPSLQDRHRGLPRSRGRGLRRGRVGARRVGVLHRLGRRPEAVARQVPRSLVRRAARDRRLRHRCRRRRPDRRRRLPGRGHGGCGSVSAPETTLYDEIQEIRALYPVSRSATLPALRLAQERYGWLSPDAFREVAEALDETPAYCMSVASFYDMYHLKPVGRHLVEVCTNVSCALVGAQQVLEAFQSELGVRAGETTDDGEVTLRTVECAGGCGWGTVVAVDHRYREPVRAEDVPGIVEELRRGS